MTKKERIEKLEQEVAKLNKAIKELRKTDNDLMQRIMGRDPNAPKRPYDLNRSGGASRKRY